MEGFRFTTPNHEGYNVTAYFLGTNFQLGSSRLNEDLWLRTRGSFPPPPPSKKHKTKSQQEEAKKKKIVYNISIHFHPPPHRCNKIIQGAGDDVGFAPDNITQPKSLNSGAEFDVAPMRLRGGSDASSGGFGWVGAKIAPYFFDWVGPYLISQGAS